MSLTHAVRPNSVPFSPNSVKVNMQVNPLCIEATTLCYALSIIYNSKLCRGSPVQLSNDSSLKPFLKSLYSIWVMAKIEKKKCYLLSYYHIQDSLC